MSLSVCHGVPDAAPTALANRNQSTSARKNASAPRHVSHALLALFARASLLFRYETQSLPNLDRVTILYIIEFN